MRVISNPNWIWISLLAAFLLPSRPGFAQANPDTYFLPSGFAPYNTLPLLLGNGFTATGGKVIVKLIGNDASNTGYLFVMDPVTGEVKFLFSNKDAKGTVLDLGAYPKDAPVVFLYVAKKEEMTPKKYTGANTAGTYDFDNDAALKGMAINHGAMPVSGEANNKGDRRWAVAGRANCTDVVFGFEDVAGGDYDYNDIVFLVEGVRLDSEIKLPAPIIGGNTRFKDTSTVTLTLPPQSPATTRIFYTTNGSAPAVNAAGAPQGATREYLAPFVLTGEATIKAFTWKPNGSADSCGGSVVYAGSEVASTNFTMLNQVKPDSGAISIRGGNYVVGGEIARPVPIGINLSVFEILDPKSGLTGECLDCKTGEWKRLDPNRPDDFPKGPELKVTTKGGFHFDFRVFDHFGQMVNRAKGTVTENMLRDVKADPQGYKSVALRWYPVSESGQHVGTGVYIVMGSVTVEPTQVPGPTGGTVRVGGSRDRINVRLGYVR
jgi:hypothetical protein